MGSCDTGLLAMPAGPLGPIPLPATSLQAVPDAAAFLSALRMLFHLPAPDPQVWDGEVLPQSPLNYASQERPDPQTSPYGQALPSGPSSYESTSGNAAFAGRSGASQPAMPGGIPSASPSQIAEAVIHDMLGAVPPDASRSTVSEPGNEPANVSQPPEAETQESAVSKQDKEISSPPPLIGSQKKNTAKKLELLAAPDVPFSALHLKAEWTTANPHPPLTVDHATSSPASFSPTPQSNETVPSNPAYPELTPAAASARLDVVNLAPSSGLPWQPKSNREAASLTFDLALSGTLTPKPNATLQPVPGPASAPSVIVAVPDGKTTSLQSSGGIRQPEHESEQSPDSGFTPNLLNLATHVPPSAAFTGAGPDVSSQRAVSARPAELNAPVDAAADGAHSPAPVNGLSVRIGTPNSPPIDLTLRHQAGQLHFGVRTPDPSLQAVLRSDLPGLVDSFNRAGFEADVSAPGAMHTTADQIVAAATFTDTQSEFNNSQHQPGANARGNASEGSLAGGDTSGRQRNAHERLAQSWLEQMEE